MSSLNHSTLESNKRFKINFDGGDLSSDSGLLLIKEFMSKLHFDKLINQYFDTDGKNAGRTHKDEDNLQQVIYQILAAYFEDDCADELTSTSFFIWLHFLKMFQHRLFQMSQYHPNANSNGIQQAFR